MAHFKTAYGQKEIVIEMKVATDLNVGDLVKLDTSDTSKLVKTTSASDAVYMIAQSDMTLNRRDYNVSEYAYSDKVAASTSTKKKVAVFKIIDKDDVIV